MAETVQRTVSGVSGFDELIGGGIPKGSLVVLSGDPGSGKTIFCLQFIYNGLEKFGENAVYISLEEKPEDIIRRAKLFGWDLEKYLDNGKFAIVTMESFDFDRIRDGIEEWGIKTKAKRVVIDPGIMMRLYFEKEQDARKRMLSLAKTLEYIGATAIVTNERGELYGLEEYLADGLVWFFRNRVGKKFERCIAIMKMRDTEISDKLHKLEITKKGLKVYV